jgi:hypothetical protein
MHVKKLDIAQRIQNLMMEIKHLVHDNEIGNKVIIDDFIDILNSDFIIENNKYD